MKLVPLCADAVSFSSLLSQTMLFSDSNKYIIHQLLYISKPGEPLHCEEYTN